MKSEKLVEFTTENWEKEVLQSEQPVVVDFWAPWCGPCRMLTPIIDRIAGQFAGKVKVGKLNIDNNQDIAVRYGISAIPQVHIFKAGAQVEHLVGVAPESELVKVINRVVGSR